jgi:hypothetical protein
MYKYIHTFYFCILRLPHIHAKDRNFSLHIGPIYGLHFHSYIVYVDIVDLDICSKALKRLRPSRGENAVRILRTRTLRPSTDFRY